MKVTARLLTPENRKPAALVSLVKYNCEDVKITMTITGSDIQGDLTDVDYCKNYDLENIHTPVNYKTFERLLKETNYDAKETDFLIRGFKEGFDVGYQGLPQDKAEQPISPSP